MVHQPRSSTWWHNRHHLFSTVNNLPCWFRNLNRNHISLPLRFQCRLRSTHDVYNHHMNSIQHFLVTRIFTDNSMDIFRFASAIQSFTQQWSRTSMCFGVCCYYRCTVYELWWTRRKNRKLAVSNLKGSVSPWLLLSVLFTFLLHLLVTTTNIAYVDVFSPLGSLMWSAHFSQGWWKRYLANPGHSSIKQTKFRLHVFL